MKIYLCNDTSRGAAGSRITMESIISELKSHTIIGKHYCGSKVISSIDECDAVVVNGEGTIHHHRPASNFLMEILKKAQLKGKKTYLINSLFQHESPYYSEVLKKLNYFSVREPLSYINACNCGGNPEILADSCLGIRIEGKRIYDIGGIIIGLIRPDSGYSNIVNHLDYPRLGITGGMLFRDMVATLKHCSLYITGQHHGIYASALAGIPFIPVPSNSHKIEGLMYWFKQETNLEIPICKGSINKHIDWALNNKEIYSKFSNFLINQKYFTGNLIDENS